MFTGQVVHIHKETASINKRVTGIQVKNMASQLVRHTTKSFCVHWLEPASYIRAPATPLFTASVAKVMLGNAQPSINSCCQCYLPFFPNFSIFSFSSPIIIHLQLVILSYWQIIYIQHSTVHCLWDTHVHSEVHLQKMCISFHGRSCF